jgi:hypothetical protein
MRNTMDDLKATPWKENVTACECCGNHSRTFWGDLSDASGARAMYYVHHTIKVLDDAHAPLIDIIVGPWGESTTAADRVLATIACHPEGAGVMVVDAAGRPLDTRDVCGRALARAEIVGTPLATELFAFVDAIMREDARMHEVFQLL